MHFELAENLKKMAREDQRVLEELLDSGDLPSDEYHPTMKEVHESNTTILKDIIEKYGWPSISLVGKEAAESAWLIAQHAVSDLDFMSSVAELLEECARKNDLEGWQLAFLQDRVNTMQGKMQVYGTQFDIDDESWPIPFPISDPDNVNERRKSLGLNTLEERLQEMKAREQLRRDQQGNG